MSSSSHSSVEDTRRQYVLVEWDDGSMANTDWYLGLITDYDAEGQPRRFRDIGVDAYPEERFLFSSCLMHCYMVCAPSFYVRIICG